MKNFEIQLKEYKRSIKNHTRAIRLNKVDLLTKLYETYEEKRIRVIKTGRKLGLSFEEIGISIGHGASRVRQLYSYGKRQGVMSKSTRREMDDYTCSSCFLKKPDVVIHAHHIRSPKNHSLNNLLTVCAGCHRRLHVIKNKDSGKYYETIYNIKNNMKKIIIAVLMFSVFALPVGAQTIGHGGPSEESPTPRVERQPISPGTPSVDVVGNDINEGGSNGGGRSSGGGYNTKARRMLLAKIEQLKQIVALLEQINFLQGK